MIRDIRRLAAAVAVAAVTAFGTCIPAFAGEQGAGDSFTTTSLQEARGPLGAQADESVIVNSWKELDDQLYYAKTDTTIVLGKDVEAAEYDRPLTPSERTLTLDLNGHNITGNGKYSVMRLPMGSNLTIKNSKSAKGNISGGSSRQGGGIENSGKLTIDGANITGNTAVNGGGIFSRGTVTIKRGSVCNNIATENGGGIYSEFIMKESQVASTPAAGSVFVEGGRIYGNKATKSGGGIYVCGGSMTFNTGDTTGMVAVKGGSIYNNTATELGGGVACYGTFVMEGGTIGDAKRVYRNMARRGGGVFVGAADFYSSKATITGGRILNNVALDVGGGICNGFGERRSGGAGGVGMSFSGCELTDNWSESHGGGIYSMASLTISGGKISRNQASGDYDKVRGSGGGVYCNGDFTMSGGSISDNQGNGDGGGVYVNAKAAISGGNITGNSVVLGSGGGLYATPEGTLDLSGGEISGNRLLKEGKQGGGVYTAGFDSKTQWSTTINVQGSPVVKDNTAMGANDKSFTNNVFLPSGNILQVTGDLKAANIGVTLASKKGRFTNGYYRMVQTKDGDQVVIPKPPSVYFTSDEGHSVSLDFTQGDYAEAILQDAQGNHLKRVRPFVPENQQFETDTRRLFSDNWMAGISGERYLNEINIPGTHDSGCRKTITYDMLYQPFNRYAQTQTSYINDQLRLGVRHIDIRLNNWNMTGSSLGGLITNWKDDGKNLWLCHGVTSFGIYYCRSPHGGNLNFEQVLTWVKEFLKDNPTETVILYFEHELNTTSAGVNEDGDKEKVFERLRYALLKTAEEKNPSTGESYLYRETDKNFLDTLSHYPQLKDCRGKIVIDYNGNGVGGIDRGAYGKVNEEDKWDAKGSEKIRLVKDFYKANNDRIPTNVDTHLSYLNYVGTYTSGPTSNYANGLGFWGNTPIDYTHIVQPELFGPGNVFDDVGRYFGWVRLDAAKASTVEQIWRSNYPDNLEYCTVNVRSGLVAENGHEVNESYQLLKGTKLKVPNCIYSYDMDARNMTFTNWVANGEESGAVAYNPGQELTVSEDLTIVAQWDFNGTPLKVVWQDGDNADRFRAKMFTIEMYSTDELGRNISPSIIISEDDGWETTISGRVERFRPIWGRYIHATGSGDITKADGRDRAGEYRYEISGNRQKGFVLTMIHTPLKTVKASGEVQWIDGGRERVRPSSVTVHLLKNGKEMAKKTATAAGNWKYSFGDLPLYENGEKVEYELTQDAVNNYATTVNGFSVINENSLLAATTSLTGNISWYDGDDASARPGSVTVHLLANGVEVDSQKVSLDQETGDWIFGFKGVLVTDDDGKEIDYKVVQDPVDGYATTTLRGEGLEIRNMKASETTDDAPLFRTHSLTLDGRIGMQFYLELPRLDGVDWKNSSMNFSASGRGAFETSDAFDADDKNATGDYYGFECDVSSIQMADRVIAELSYEQGGKKKSAYQAYSVARYVQEFDAKLAADPSAFDAKTVTLVHSMADYGHYAQPYLAGVRGWKVGDDYAEMPAASTLSADAVGTAREGTNSFVTGYHMTSQSEREIDKLSVALDLETDTSLYVFAYTKGGASVTGVKLADGTKLDVEHVSGNCWRATVSGIMAQRLSKEFDVAFTTSSGAQASVTASALSVARDLVRSSDTDARLAGTALYNYWKAADDYLS